MPAALYVWFFFEYEIKWSRQQTSSICFGLTGKGKWSNVCTADMDGRSMGPKRRADKSDCCSAAQNFTLLPLDVAQGYTITGTLPTSKCSGTVTHCINHSRRWKRCLFTCTRTGLSLLTRERFSPGFGTPPIRLRSIKRLTWLTGERRKVCSAAKALHFRT